MFEDILTTQFDILRHGECEGGHIFRGTTDVPLLEKGMVNMHNACEKVSEPWHAIISSPLMRCHAFAKIQSQRLSIPLTVDERLREMSFGDWEGKLIEQVWREQYEEIHAWMKDPALSSPPNGEVLSEVFARINECYHELLQAHRGKRILLVTHGGIIRVLLANLLEMPESKIQRLDVPYASLSRVAVYHMDHGDQVKLSAHNF